MCLIFEYAILGNVRYFRRVGDFCLGKMRIEDFIQGDYQFAQLIIHGESDEILRGKYCEVKCHPVSPNNEQGNTYFVPTWKNVGSKSEMATDEERIARAISDMPHADYFITFTTFDQVREWIGCKDCFVEIAQCFLTEQGQPDDLLLAELKAGRIDQFSYDYIWTEANIYKSLWSILKKKAEVIKCLLEKCTEAYLFTSSRELLIEIIKEDLEGAFIGCLKRRYTYKASHIVEIAKLKRKEHRIGLADEEQERLYLLMDQYVPYAKWLNYTLLAVNQLAKTDQFTKVNLETYQANLAELTKLQIQKNCNPKLKKHRRSSHTWEKGRYKHGASNWDA